MDFLPNDAKIIEVRTNEHGEVLTVYESQAGFIATIEDAPAASAADYETLLQKVERHGF